MFTAYFLFALGFVYASVAPVYGHSRRVIKSRYQLPNFDPVPTSWPQYTCHDGSNGNPFKQFTIGGSGKSAYSWYCGDAAALPSLPSVYNNTVWESGRIVSETMGPAPSDDNVPHRTMQKRDTSIIGAPCTVYCNTGTNGPDPNDCNQLLTADETAGGFTIPAGSYLVWTWLTCQVIQTNLLNPAQDLDYSYDLNDWAGIVSELAYNCQAAENAMGGSCHYDDSTSTSIIQVQLAPNSD